MKSSLKGFLLSHRLTKNAYCDLFKLKMLKRDFDAKPQRAQEKGQAVMLIENMTENKKHIFFCGVPVHKNMGDQAQRYCIRLWCQQNYPDHEILEISTWPFYERDFRERIKKAIKKDDLIVIQSGYCTTDRHYDHKMHRFLVKTFPENKILIMPQTVNFIDEREGYKTGKIYAEHKHLLFLARDKVSYQSAKRFFPSTDVQLYPDIVTTLIGSMPNTSERDGVLLCIRNDSEKKYTDDEIKQLKNKLQEAGLFCEIADTNSNLPLKELIANFSSELEKTLDFFASHKVVITDRYHGTIFSMISNTPVIVIATNDHKVKTGTEWFKGIYANSQYNADSLDEAYSLAMNIMKTNNTIVNKPYFKTEYYDKLKSRFEIVD